MKTIKEKVHPLMKLVGFLPESKIILNQKEKAILKQAQAVLNHGSKLNEQINPRIEPHEDQFFIASVEIDYILEGLY